MWVYYSYFQAESQDSERGIFSSQSQTAWRLIHYIQYHVAYAATVRCSKCAFA